MAPSRNAPVARVNLRAAILLRAAVFVAALWSLDPSLVIASPMMPGMDSVVADPGAPPMMESGGGSFYSQDLGTILRLRYSTESYGQHGDGHGNFDIGTMQVATFEDSIAFFDGQVTLNDVQGVGFNVGVGYRWMSFQPYASAAGRIQGVSIWADGTSTEADNFFPQLGLSYESLGDMWDLRANGYIPLGAQDQVGDFRPTGEIGFFGTSVGELTEAVVDSSFFAAEAEFARRLGNERDAWAFAGPYFLANDNDDTIGYRVGPRGYAYPDLLVQLAVTDDEIFNTNAAFSVTWFVGRTRTDYRPACGVPDRFREPVMRNDYVVLAQSTVAGGNAFTDAEGNLLRIIHVDSNAAPGGDGSFENPFDMLTDVNGAGSQAGDIIFAHSESVFTGENIILKNNQRLLGEGDGFQHTIVTSEEGSILIPESSPGSRALDRPMILAAPGDAITLADNNEVANFDIDGQGVTARAIASPAGGAGNPNLHDLRIENTTGDGIFFRPLLLTDTNDIDNDNNTTEQFVRGSVTIRNVTFDSIGGDDIDIDSATTADLTSPNIALQETITISDVTSTNGNGAGIRLANTHDNRAANITNYMNGQSGVAGSGGGNLAGDVGVLRFEGTGMNRFAGDVVLSNVDIVNNESFAIDLLNVDSLSTITMSGNSSYDGGAGMAGGIRMNDVDGIFTAINSTFTNGTLAGVFITGGSDGTITFGSGATFNSIDGTTFDINDFTGTFRADEDIMNDTGRVVSIQTISQAGTTVTFLGDITDTGSGILINNNTAGTILFSGDLELTTEMDDAIVITGNAAAVDINFGGEVDITTTSGAGFRATGGGMLTVSNTNNSITTETGRIVEIIGMAINSPTGVNFAEIDRTGAGPSSAVVLTNNTGGPILLGTVGDNAGESGTIAAGTGNAIEITNSANVTISGLTINNSAGASGIRVEKSNAAASTVNLNDLDINDGGRGIEVIGGGTGGLAMTVNDTTIDNSTLFGMDFNNVDVGTILVFNADLDGGNVGATAGGVRIQNSDATFNFDAQSTIREFNGTDFEINGGMGTVSFAGDIINATSVNAGDNLGRSIHVRNVSGGTVNFTATNSVNDDNQGILVENNSNGTINFLGDYDLNTGSADAVTITGNTGATINIGNLDIDTTTGQGFVATGGGTLSVTGNANTITRTAGGAAGHALRIEDMTIGSVDFESVNATGGVNGIRLVNNTGGTITIGDPGNAAGQGGTISGTTDAGVHVTDSNVVLNGVTVQNAGNAAGENAVEIFHTNATAMSANLNRLTVNNATAARDGVVIDGTGGSGTFNANIQNLDVNVTGDGLVVNDGVTLTAGGTNTITSDTGVGLQVTDSTIAGAGANFQSVNVTNGATNGVVMQNVTGGQIAITGIGVTANSGGSLTTTGDAIVLSDVQNVDLINMRVVNTGGQAVNIDHTSAATTAMDVTINRLNVAAAANEGLHLLSDNDANEFALKLNNSNFLQSNVVMDVTGAGHFGLLVDNTDITTDVGSLVRAFDLQFHDGATAGDVTIRNTSNFTADDGEALFIDSFDATLKDIKLLVEDSTFTNVLGTEPAADIRSRGNTIFQATIQGNDFTASGATDDLIVRSNGTASARMRLNLGGEDPSDFNSALGAGSFLVSEEGTSVFSIFQRDETITADIRNNDPVDTFPNDAAFQNLGTAPTLPTVPAP